MASVESELARPGDAHESVASLLDALDRENAELRERLVSLGGDAARFRAELKFARRGLEEARTEAQEALTNVRALTEERDRENGPRR